MVMMRSYILVLLLAVTIPTGFLNPTPLDDLTINLNLNELPKGDEEDVADVNDVTGQDYIIGASVGGDAEDDVTGQDYNIGASVGETYNQNCTNRSCPDGFNCCMLVGTETIICWNPRWGLGPVCQNPNKSLRQGNELVGEGDVCGGPSGCKAGLYCDYTIHPIRLGRCKKKKKTQTYLANLAEMTKKEIKQIPPSSKQRPIHHNVTNIDKLEVGFCPGSPRPFSIDLATVKPFPVVIATGQSVTINFKLTLNTPIPKGSTVTLKIKKHESWPFPDLPIPCVEFEGKHVGSCTYSVDFLLEQAAPVLCPTFVPPGQECKLPLRPGVYGGVGPLVLGPIKEVPQVIADLLANGEYDAKVYLRTKSGDLQACVFVKVSLTH